MRILKTPLSLLFTLTLLLISSGAQAADPWANDPLLSKESCADITYKDIAEFVVKYSKNATSQSNIKVAANELAASYIVSAIAVNQANLCLADALALKSATDDLLVEREILKGGSSASKKELKKHRQIAASANEQIQEAALKTATLEPEQKKSFVVGASAYLLGTYKTYEIKKDGEKLVKIAEKEAKSQSSGGFSLGSMKAKLGKGADYAVALKVLKKVLSGLPKHLPKLVTTAKFFIEYADKVDVELDEDATSDFNSMG